MKVIVSSNCQTAGIAASLRAMLVGSQIEAIPYPYNNEKIAVDSLKKQLKDADIWITNGPSLLAAEFQVKCIKLPAIGFSAFHPDMCYAKIQSTNTLTKYHYNSVIAVWAFNNNVEINDVVKLYNPSTFQSLGYFDRWQASFESLKANFMGLDFSQEEFLSFWLAIKRQGLFMHTLNHPRSPVLAEVAKILASRLGASRSLIDREIIIPDTLWTDIWPVYPEIAAELGLPGGYCWRIAGEESEGLVSYLEFAFNEYSNQGIHPSQLVIVDEPKNLHRLLMEELGKL